MDSVRKILSASIRYSLFFSETIKDAKNFQNQSDIKQDEGKKDNLEQDEK